MRYVFTAAYSAGAALPTLTAFSTTTERIFVFVPAAAIGFLAALGALGARLGGAPILAPVLRAVLSGALAMAVTAVIGALIGKAV
jgi:VIT1/CCC1 family predicted Fe2+/Mn2+ transporter